MVLPLSPSTTYVAGTTPSIKAADLNDLQTYLAGAYVGTRTVKALTVDGTGGAAATPTAGTLNVGANTKQVWLHASDFAPDLPANWLLITGTAASGNSSWIAGAGGKFMIAKIPLPFQVGGAAATTVLTNVAVRVKVVGGVAMTAGIYVMTGLGSAIAVTSTLNASAVNLGAGPEDSIAVAAIGTVTATVDKYVTVQVTSGQVGDVIHGALVSYTSSVF